MTPESNSGGRRSIDPDLEALFVVLKQQDQMLERIYQQAAATNGRVTALEKREAVREAIREERAALLRDSTSQKDEDLRRSVHVADGRRDRRAMLLSGMVASSGAIIVTLTHFLITGHWA